MDGPGGTGDFKPGGGLGAECSQYAQIILPEGIGTYFHKDQGPSRVAELLSRCLHLAPWQWLSTELVRLPAHLHTITLFVHHTLIVHTNINTPFTYVHI